MLVSEFVEMTGYQPEGDEYKNEIEPAYNEFDGDKQQFCKEWIRKNPTKAGSLNRARKEQEYKWKNQEKLDRLYSKLYKKLYKKYGNDFEISNLAYREKEDIVNDIKKISKLDNKELKEFSWNIRNFSHATSLIYVYIIEYVIR